jgi:hypothetical protein
MSRVGLSVVHHRRRLHRTLHLVEQEPGLVRPDAHRDDRSRVHLLVTGAVLPRDREAPLGSEFTAAGEGHGQEQEPLGLAVEHPALVGGVEELLEFVHGSGHAFLLCNRQGDQCRVLSQNNSVKVPRQASLLHAVDGKNIVPSGEFSNGPSMDQPWSTIRVPELRNHSGAA